MKRAHIYAFFFRTEEHDGSSLFSREPSGWELKRPTLGTNRRNPNAVLLSVQQQSLVKTCRSRGECTPTAHVLPEECVVLHAHLPQPFGSAVIWELESNRAFKLLKL